MPLKFSPLNFQHLLDSWTLEKYLQYLEFLCIVQDFLWFQTLSGPGSKMEHPFDGTNGIFLPNTDAIMYNDCCKSKFVPSTAPPTNPLMKQRRYLVFPENKEISLKKVKDFIIVWNQMAVQKNWDSLQVLMWRKIWLSQHYH